MGRVGRYTSPYLSHRPPMTPTEPTIAVLFADVAGSTRLYEQVGDALALATIGKCLTLVDEVSRGHGGRLIKTIGDEAMVAFPTADQAAAAAAEIQGRMTDFAQAGNYRIAFRIGFHCGAAIERDGDVFGDSVNVAARMVGLAKSGQVILSAPTAEALSAALRERLREVDVMTVKGKEKDIGILELLWQDSADLTSMAPRPKRKASRLELRHGERAIELSDAMSSLSLGRDTQNDVVIADRMASRLHAKIERRREHFMLVDQSSNGTFVTVDGEGEFEVRREEFKLRGRGHISFGHSHAASAGETLTFCCVEGDG